GAGRGDGVCAEDPRPRVVDIPAPVVRITVELFVEGVRGRAGAERARCRCLQTAEGPRRAVGPELQLHRTDTALLRGSGGPPGPRCASYLCRRPGEPPILLHATPRPLSSTGVP